MKTFFAAARKWFFDRVPIPKEVQPPFHFTVLSAASRESSRQDIEEDFAFQTVGVSDEIRLELVEVHA
ncbi:MAG: hypothetical protein IJF17_00875 [Thermoguttaceae bacterium]|nr:hypothetical protein [Thermoguttaceae bacterium]